MKMNRIKFENYRCFLNGEIVFPTSKEHNMTLLIAPNGSGKTETLFAFWWVLYGYDFSKLTNKENTPYALNADLYRSLENSPMGTKKACEVELEFEHNNTRYLVLRREEFKKTERQIKKEDYRTIRTYKENGELSLPERNPDKINRILNNIIPKSILYGILFDGERMQKLNTPDENSKSAIMGVVNDITNIELLESCRENFDSVRKNVSRNLAQKNKKTGNLSLAEVLKKLEDDEKIVDQLSKKIPEEKDRRDSIQIRLDEISGLLSRNKEVKEIENKRNTARELLRAEDKNLETNYKRFSDSLKDGYLLATNPLLNDVDNIIETYDVPQGLTVQAVKNILKRDTCICGRPFEQHSRDELEHLILMLPPDNINSSLSEIVRQRRSGIDETKCLNNNRFDVVRESERRKNDLQGQIASLSSQISSLDADGSAAREAKALEQENIDLRVEQKRINEAIPKDEYQERVLRAEITKLRAQRDVISSSSHESIRLSKQLDYLEKCLDAVERIKTINKQTALEQINTNLMNAYELLSEDAERGRRIRIIQYNEARKYQIAVYLQSEYEKMLSLWKADGTYERKERQGLSESEISEQIIINCVDSNSTGQSKINTFAFVKAILDYSNSQKSNEGIEVTKDYPLLIDAPFGDLSAGNLKKSSSELHTFANQIILMIDEDKYSSLRTAFDPYVAKRYTFVKSHNSNNSTIKMMEDINK